MLAGQNHSTDTVSSGLFSDSFVPILPRAEIKISIFKIARCQPNIFTGHDRTLSRELSSILDISVEPYKPLPLH